MAALNFPTTNLVAGVTEYSANGTTYLWDGVKWVGRTAGGAAGTNSLQNNGHTVQVDSGGNLVLPAFAMPNTVGTTGQVLKWPASGSTLAWANDNNSGGGADLGKFIFDTDQDRAFISTTDDAGGKGGYDIVLIPGGEGYSSITIPRSANAANAAPLSIEATDANSAVQISTDAGTWTFGNTGILTLPAGGAITSPDYNFSFNKNPGDPAIPTLGTDITTVGEGDIATGEVYMGSGYGEFRSIFNKGDQIDSGLVYAGVEGFNYVQYGDVNFAGMVSQTPNIDSMYTVGLDAQGQITIGFTQAGQTQESTDWSVAVGSLNTNMTVNGLFANTSVTAIATGEWSWKFDNTGNLAMPYGSLILDSGYETGTAGFIAPSGGVALGSTMLYNSGNIASQILQNREGSGSTIQISAYQDNSNPAKTWTFDNNGILNLPNNNGQIGALEAPYTGLEFRTGSDADWIGISYGEINDNNTSYFYFDKDGSDYTTANHRAHLQLKNAAHDGHVEWLFDVTGNLTLPAGGDILNSSGQSVLGGGGNANTGNFTFDADTITNSDGLILATTRGNLAIGTNMEGPGVAGHFHIGFDGSNSNPPANDLFLGDDNNYVKLPGYELDPTATFGVEIGTDNRGLGPQNIEVFTVDELVPPGGVWRLFIDHEDYPNLGSLVSVGDTVTTAWGTPITATITDVIEEPGNQWKIHVAQDITAGFSGGDTVSFGRSGDSYTWRFGTDGNLSLPQGSTISDQAESVDLTVYHPSESAYWYNLFGDTGATVSANVAINGSVVYDAGGNVYVLGSTIGNNFDSNNNLFLKYSPLGELLWRRTWTDNDGLSCGSYNASLRYIEANVDLGTQDTILWAAQTPNNNISYVGTMDMEGNMVDQFGNVRLPTRLDNFAVTDLEWATDIGVPYVVVVGQLHVDGTGYNYPTFAGVDLDTAEIIDDITVVPAGTDLTAGLFSGPGWANSFKALTVFDLGDSTTPSISAVVGSYYDGSHTHAMVTLSAGAGPLTVGIGVDNHGGDDVIGEDICCDANGNVYVIVNNISSNYAVVLCGTAGSIESGSALWQRRIGDLSGSDDSFYATAVTYSSGHVYVLGQFYQDNIDDTDVMLIKLNKYTGNIVWSRRIGSAGDDGLNFVGDPGWESSSGIHVQDGLIVISFATEAQTKDLNQGFPDLNTVTLQYPQDGSLLGTFGDFEITDFEPAIGSIDYSITTLTTTGSGIPFTSGFATLQATTAAVGTGWTNTQWDMDQNREVYPTQTWRFMTDGSFDTAEIKHVGEVKITANTVSGTNASTWTFQNNDGLRFPDGSVQYGAYVQTEMSMDGGSAATVYNIISVPPVADGGGSASRFGNYDPVYDGSNGDNYVLDGGGA